MNTKPSMVSRFAGLACLVLLTASAGAVTVSTGDLILGIRADGGQGSGKDLVINIGPASTFSGLASNSSIPVPGLSVQDLITTFGSNWASRTDLRWGVAGTTGLDTVGTAPPRTIWASRAEPVPGATSVPWQRNIALNLQNSSQAIGSIYKDAPGSLNIATATPNSPSAALIDDTLPGSWTAQDDFSTGTSFRYFNPTVTGSMSEIPGTASIYDGVNGYGALDLWEIRPGTAGSPAALLGAFGLNNSGGLVFSNIPGAFAPVPEPSAFLTGLGAGLVLLMRRRR